MIKLIERYYKGQTAQRAEEYLIDTDAELKDLPKAPAGSFAISVESGKKFYNNSSGLWPEDPSKYAGGGGGSSGGEGESSQIDALIEGSITEITSGVGSIKSGLLANYKSLVSVDFFNMTEVPYQILYGCDNLETAKFPLATGIAMSAFNSCSKLKNTNFPLVTDSYSDAFYNCTSLTEVYLPKLKTVGQRAFCNCTSLIEVDFPLASTVYQTAFKNCESLTTVNLPLMQNVLTDMFNGCKSLPILRLSGASNIGTRAFSGCESLKTIILDGGRYFRMVTLSDITAFDNTPFAVGGSGGTVYVPEAHIEQYKTATNWSVLYEAGTVTFLPIEGSEFE